MSADGEQEQQPDARFRDLASLAAIRDVPLHAGEPSPSFRLARAFGGDDAPDVEVEARADDQAKYGR